MNNIDILMATYNGASYIRTQIQSLQAQTLTDWKLYIHDDGSSDDTMSILKEMKAIDSRINIIEDGIRFHESGLNFMHLLKFSKAPFCIFCDQDDIWLENKLELMLRFIEAKDNTIPQAVYSNSYVYIPETSDISGYATLCFPKKLKDVLFLNSGIQGCALMFNAALRDICKNAPDIVAMHDHVLTVCAAALGELSYLNKRLMLYRRHQSTVTGPTAKKLSDRYNSFFDMDKTVMSHKHYQALKSLYQKYETYISDDNKKIFSDYFRFEKECRIRRFFHVLAKGYKLYGRTSILAIKVLLRKFV